MRNGGSDTGERETVGDSERRRNVQGAVRLVRRLVECGVRVHNLGHVVCSAKVIIRSSG